MNKINIKKTFARIAACAAISFVVSPISNAGVDNIAINGDGHEQLVTKRQVVDMLLSDALVAFKSPSRISHAGFTAKMPSNLELVTNRLLEAYKLEPYRTDLLISAANAQVYNKNIERAIELFNQALTVAPEDIDVLSYLSVWERFSGNLEKSESYLKKLAQLNSYREKKIRDIFSLVETILQTPLKTTRDQLLPKERSAIVTLGYALNPDGSMHDILINRLEITLTLAKQNPDSLIILTGGVPKNHKTEGSLMAQWLIKNGVKKKRIIEENYATSTVGNALYSSYILARHKINTATIVSSASHVRRGQTLFEIASWQSGPANISFDTVAYADKPLKELKVASRNELLGIYRDALRTYGMWSYRSYPLESR